MELLIVIVVIAILAAITIVAYRGVQDRAKASAASSAATQARKKVELYKAENDTYPATLAATGLVNSGSASYQYTLNTSTNTYCITATSSNVSYYVNNSSTTTPTAGGCPGHGQGGVAAITNLHPNPGATACTTAYSSNTGPSNVSAMAAVSAPWSTSGSGCRVTWTTAGSTTGDLGIYTNSNAVLTAGQTYTLQYRISAGQASTIGNAGIWASSGVYSIITSNAGSVAVSANSPITRWVTFTGDAAALSTGLRIVQTPTIATGYYYEISDVMLYEGAYQSGVTFKWGNSPNWIWNGTANNSTSSGPPQ